MKLPRNVLFGNRRLSLSAFTLVEITLAIGIASFAVVSMLGVLAVGMTTMKSAVDDTVHTMITQEVVGALRQANFSQLSNAAAWSWEFDNRGLPTGGDKQAQVYGATVRVEPTQLSGGVQNPNLLRVQVSITNIAEPGRPRVISTFIANNGQ